MFYSADLQCFVCFPLQLFLQLLQFSVVCLAQRERCRAFLDDRSVCDVDCRDFLLQLLMQLCPLRLATATPHHTTPHRTAPHRTAPHRTSIASPLKNTFECPQTSCMCVCGHVSGAIKHHLREGWLCAHVKSGGEMTVVTPC